MKLTNAELLNFLSYYVFCEEKDGYIFPKRFTEKQLEIAKNRGFFPRPNSTASMFLEFITDASEIKFDYFVCPGSSKEYFSLDVLENGINTFNYDNSLKTEKGTMIIPLEKEGKKKVTIYLPNLAGLGIKNFEINGKIEKTERKRKLLALGDSITQGYTTHHPYLTYVNLLAYYSDAYVLNQGIGGDVFYAGNLDESINFDPDIITVAYGTNDWSRQQNVKENADAYFEKLRKIYPQKPIFALLPIFRGGIQGDLRNGYSLEDIRKQIVSCAKKHKVFVINCKDFVPHHEDYFFDKTLHPNELGFIFYAKGVFEELKKHLPLNV